MSLGSRSQQVQSIRIDPVEAIEEPQPRSRSQQWHCWHHGTRETNRWGSTTKCTFGAAKGALKGEAVQCRALVRRAD